MIIVCGRRLSQRDLYRRKYDDHCVVYVVGVSQIVEDPDTKHLDAEFGHKDSIEDVIEEFLGLRLLHSLRILITKDHECVNQDGHGDNDG